jgi:hypothetical protein
MKFQRNAEDGRPRTSHTDINCVIDGLVREIESKFVKGVNVGKQYVLSAHFKERIYYCF